MGMLTGTFTPDLSGMPVDVWGMPSCLILTACEPVVLSEPEIM